MGMAWTKLILKIRTSAVLGQKGPVWGSVHKLGARSPLPHPLSGCHHPSPTKPPHSRLRPLSLSPPSPPSEEQEPPCFGLAGASAGRADARKHSGTCPATPSPASGRASPTGPELPRQPPKPPTRLRLAPTQHSFGQRGVSESINKPPAAQNKPPVSSALQPKRREGTFLQADHSIPKAMGYFSYRRNTMPSSRRRWERCSRFPREKISSSPSEEAGQQKGPLRFRCREAGLTPPLGISCLEQGDTLRGIAGGFKAASSPREMLPEKATSQH